MNETTKMPEAARDLEPVPIAGINVTSNDGDHVLYEDAGTNSGASGDNESMLGAILEGDINDAGPMVAVVNEAALGNGDNLIVHQAVAGEHNLDDVGDKAAPGIQMDGYGHHLFRYFNRSSALLAFVAISFSFAIAFSLRLTAQ